MTAFYVATIIFFVLFFPLKIVGHIYVDLLKKECAFGVFFAFIKLISGNVFFSNKKIKIKIGKFKEILVPIFSKIDINFALHQGLIINEISYMISVGSKENDRAIFIAILYNQFNLFLEEFISSHTKSVKTNGALLLNLDEKETKGQLKISIIFNLFIVIVVLVKLILLRMLKWVNKAKKR